MSLLEFNLEKPAYKRVSGAETDDETETGGEIETDAAETTSTDADDSGRRSSLGVAALLAAIVAALAIKRRRA